MVDVQLENLVLSILYRRVLLRCAYLNSCSVGPYHPLIAFSDAWQGRGKGSEKDQERSRSGF